jgi:hypothetical protein
MIRRASITGYLLGLAALATEVAARPELLATFLGILALVPRTITELAVECPAPRIRRPWLDRAAARR